jgi:hypothetical protein
VIKDKLINWCKRVFGGREKSTRSMAPQGEIKTPASRTRAMVPEIFGDEIFGDSSLCPDCGHYRHGDRECGQPRRNQDPCRCAAERPEDQLPEPGDDALTEGVITAESAKIFLRYLEGDQEAAKIVHGWALSSAERSPDRAPGSSVNRASVERAAEKLRRDTFDREHGDGTFPGERLPLRVTDGYGHAPKAEFTRASPSGEVHDDPEAPHDPYAIGFTGDGPRRGLRCLLGLHDDGTDAFGGHSATCLRCGAPV